MGKERLIAFTDAVLAIIMTILVLELEKPDAPTIEAFFALRQNFFAYFLSFFWLGSLWMALNTLWEKVEKISTTVCNWFLHKALDKPNEDNKELLLATEAYRRLLIPDIAIKAVGFVLATTVYPPIMMYSVLLAAAYIITLKHFKDKAIAMG